MNTKWTKMINVLKNRKLLWSIIALSGLIGVGVYAFGGAPVGCTPETCTKPLTQDYTNQRVGINNATPKVALDVNGGMRIGQFLTADIGNIPCDGNRLGSLVFDKDENIVKVCKSGGWSIVGEYLCNPLNPLGGITYSSSDNAYLLGGTQGDSDKAKAQLICISNYQHISNGASGNPLTVNYKLMANVDFDGAGENWDLVGALDVEGWKPMGNVGAGINAFSGNFDGNHKAITNLYIDRPEVWSQGLFGRVETSTEISNLNLIDVDITGQIYTGGISGVNGKIENSYISGSVHWLAWVGGFIGSSGFIDESYSTCNVTGNGTLWGLVGEHGTISKSYATGDVSGGTFVGGLVGYAWTISNSFATGNVSASYAAGGLVGYNTASRPITNSYASSLVSGTGDYIGALVGYESTPNEIIKSYAINNPTLNPKGDSTSFDVNNFCSVGKNAGCTANVYTSGSMKTSWDDAIWDNLSDAAPQLVWASGSNTTS